MYAQLIKPGTRVKLSDYDPSFTDELKKSEAKDKLDEIGKEMSDLEDLLFATKEIGVLLVFQGMDTAGKDGAINQVLKYVNVQSTKVWSFKVPTEIELSHDFLWRIHQKVPAKGGMTLFNRSHYEDVLVVRVHDLAPKSVWEKRYDHINAFESLLADSNIVIRKFFLHISKEEQKERLIDREKEVEKSWKLSVGDWKERELWEDYQHVYEDALSKCSTERAPWYIVPANHKWFRDAAIAEVIVDALRPYKKQWLESLKDTGIQARKELDEYRAIHPDA